MVELYLKMKRARRIKRVKIIKNYKEKLMKYKITYEDELVKVNQAIEDLPGRQSFLDHKEDILVKLKEVDILIAKEDGIYEDNDKYEDIKDYLEENEEDEDIFLER